MATTTETRTMTLGDFLGTYAAVRVWYTSTGSPAGQELALNVGDDVADEDYCDAESLLSFIPEGTADLEGTVTRFGRDKWRWEVDSLADAAVKDQFGNTIFDLVVWGEDD